MIRNYEVEQKADTKGRLWWYVTREGAKRATCQRTNQDDAIDEAVRLTKGRGQIKHRDPETGQWTEKSR